MPSNPNPFDALRGQFAGPRGSSGEDELTRQLGFIVSRAAPDFRPTGGRNNGDGLVDGIVQGLFGNPERDANQALLGSELEQNRALTKDPVIPGKGAPRPKEVVQGFQKEGFSMKNLRSAIQAIAGSPYELAINQGDPETQAALANASVPDFESTDELLRMASGNPDIARQLDRTAGAGRANRVEFQRKKIENTAMKQRRHLEELADPYSSAMAAEVYLRTGEETGVGAQMAEAPGAKMILADDKRRSAYLDAAPLLTQVDESQLRPAFLGETKRVHHYPDQDFDIHGNMRKGASMSAGSLASAVVNGGVVKGNNGKNFQLALTGGGDLDSLLEQAREILLEDADGDTVPDDDLIAFEYVMNGLDSGRKINPESLARAQRAKELLDKQGEALNWQEVGGPTRISFSDEKVLDELYPSREVNTGEWQGQPTLATQYGLNQSQAETVVKALEHTAQKNVGSLDVKIRRELEKDLERRGYDNEIERMSILNKAMPAVRGSIISQNARKYADKDFARFVARSVMPEWKRFAEESQLKDDSRLSKTGKLIAKDQDTRDEIQAKQQLLAEQMGGGMGMPEPGDWLLEEEAAREKYAYPGPQELPSGRALGDVSNPQMVSNIRAKKSQRASREEFERNPYGLQDALDAVPREDILGNLDGLDIGKVSNARMVSNVRAKKKERRDRPEEAPMLTPEQLRFLQTPGAMEALDQAIKEAMQRR